MTIQIFTVLIIIALMTVSFFTEILPLGFTALMVPVLLQGTGILNASQAWSGFSNATVITWIGMFIIGSVFAKTSFTYRIKNFVKTHSGNSQTRVIIMILIACTIMGLMTTAAATLAALTPIINEICDDNDLDRKRVFKSVADVSTWACVQMLPIGSSLSYFILFNEYLETSGTDLRYGLLDMTWIKLPMWIILVAYYIFAARKMGTKNSNGSIAKKQKIVSEVKSSYTPAQEKMAVFVFTANTVLMVIASFTKIVPVYLVSTTFAALAVGLRLVTEKEALSSVSWNIIFLVAGSLPLSTAINVSGTGTWVSNIIQNSFPSLTNPVILATAFCIVSMICTQFMNNTAVWAVFSPIAAVMAINLNMDPRLVVAGVACGALICFATPMAAVAGAYAYGICDFNMKEYIKLGWVPCILMMAVFVIWAPIILNIIY
ncbi:MAG: hypothetical protein EGQ98_00465 [Clostridium sp.]|nr:hypothetical protein [Clostridium sp.]